MPAPLITVVIPTYNSSAFIGKCLESVLSQDYDNIEVIVVDNCSTDTTLEIVNGFDDDRICVLSINNNGIISKSRNLGIKHSSGDWVAFLDSDDWWRHDKLAECVKAVSESSDKPELIYHDVFVVKNDSKSLLKSIAVKNNYLKALITNGNFIVNSSVMLSRDLMERVGMLSVDQEMVGAEDYNYWIRCARETDAFLHIDKGLAYYLVHSGGVSNKNMSKVTEYAVKSIGFNIDDDFQQVLSVNLLYIDVRYKFVNRELEGLEEKLIYLIKYADIKKKIKSIYMWLRLKLI